MLVTTFLPLPSPHSSTVAHISAFHLLSAWYVLAVLAFWHSSWDLFPMAGPAHEWGFIQCWQHYWNPHVKAVTCIHAKSLQPCLTLCDPVDCGLPGSSVYGILQARILEWVAIPVSRISSEPKNQTWLSLIAGRFFTFWATREAPRWANFLDDK